MKQNRDVKFIIYQVLYIFVIVVLTMKGADINLDKVLKEDEAVKKTYSDSLKKYIDSLLALGLIPRIEFDSLKNIADLKVFPTPVIPAGIILKPGERVVREEDIKVPEVKTDQKLDKQIELQVVQPTQYTVNSITNRNNEPLYVLADGNTVATVSPGSTMKYTLGDQKTVTYRCGGTEKHVNTLPNRLHKIVVELLNAGGEETTLRSLQAGVACRIRIDDDFVDQIDVQFKGSVRVETKGNGVYDISLKLCASKSQFDSMYGNKDAPYKTTLEVTATDKISGRKISQQRTFTFGEW